MVKKLLFSLVAALGFTTLMYAQESTEHWIPPIPGSQSNSSTVGQTPLYLSTLSDVQVTVELYQGSAVTPFQTLTLPANGTEVEFMAFQGPNRVVLFDTENGMVINDRGLRIVADAPVSADLRIRSTNNAQADLIASKGNNARGTTFRLGGTPMGTTTAAFVQGGTTGENDFSHFVSFMAVEDNTTVNVFGFTEDAEIIGVNDGNPVPAGHVETVTINAGETYLMRQRYPRSEAEGLGNGYLTWNAMIGALLESDKDVVVNVGNLHASPSSQVVSRDYAADQIIPVEAMGTEFVFSRGEGENLRELVLVVAHTNNTSIFLNGDVSPVATLQAGEWYVVNGGSDDASTTAYTDEDNMHIRTTNPAQAYQIVSDAAGSGQVGMFLVPPLICTAPRVAYIPDARRIWAANYNAVLMIVTRSDAELTINGTLLQDYLTAGTITNYGTNDINGHYVNGSTNFVSYKLAGTALTGDVLIESTRDLYCGLLGTLGIANYGGYFSGFTPTITLHIDEAACLPQTVSVGADIFDGYRWFRNDVQVASGTPEYTITEAGEYYLLGDTSGCESIQSNTITVDAVDVPTGQSPQRLCAEDTPTLEDLVVDPLTPSQVLNNYTVVWYADQTTSTTMLPDPANRLPLNTPLVDETSYFAAFVEHDGMGNELCESAIRFEIIVLFDEIPDAPTLAAGDGVQTFCGHPSPSVNDLVATPAPGTELAWFDVPSGGARLPGIMPLLDGVTYYAESFDESGISCDNTNRIPVLVELEGPVSITDHIDDITVCAGGDAAFTVIEDNGTGGTLTYLWEESTDGTTWTEIMGETAATYTRTGVDSAIDDGLQIRVNVGTPACSGVQQSFATLTVEGPITINTQPMDVTACANGSATFSVDATMGSASGTLSYMWEESIDGGNTWQIVGFNKNYVKTPLAASLDGHRYRVLVGTGACNTVVSEEVVLTIGDEISIGTELSDATVCAGSDAVFNVVASTENGGLTYSWEESTDNGLTWSELLGETSPSYVKEGTVPLDNGNLYRVRIGSTSCPSGSSTSMASLWVEGPLAIVGQPTDQTVCEGGSATFGVDVGESGRTDHRFEWETSRDGGASWDVVGHAAILMVFPVSGADDGAQYRVYVSSGACAAILSETVSLQVRPEEEIFDHPENVEAVIGGTAEFMVTLAGESVEDTYQWQEHNGNGWTDLEDGGMYSGTGTDVLRIDGVVQEMDGNRYRVRITGCSGTVTSDHALLGLDNGRFPDMFSPNGDGTNDSYVVPYLMEFPEFTMEIYDRWGNMVHKVVNHGSSEPNWWDGTSSGRMNYREGEIVPAGTYYYLVHYDREGTKAPKTGWVYLRK